MTSLNFKCTPLRTAALLAALGLGGALSAPAWAAGPATAPAPAATSTADTLFSIFCTCLITHRRFPLFRQLDRISHILL